MKTILIALTLAALTGTPAGATPNYDLPRYEALGAQCEAGVREACRTLADETDGQCAGPLGSECHYVSTVVAPHEPMVLVQGLEALGYSRISTVEHCADVVGVVDYTNLVTDSEYEGMEACLIEHT